MESRVVTVDRRLTARPVECRRGGRSSGARAARRTAADVDVLSGYAAVFNEETVIAGMFRERILPGAFTDSVATDDIPAQFNHDPNYVLGRTTNHTVRLVEDTIGLRYEVDLNAQDPEAVRIGAIIARGDVRGSSFAFSVDRDEDEQWDYTPIEKGLLPLRTITRARLWDVAPVTTPAYPTTSVSAQTAARLSAHGGRALVELLDHELALDLLELDAAPRPQRSRLDLILHELDLMALECL